MEIIATNSFPEQHLSSVKQFAKDLVLLLAFHLAERISSLLRQVQVLDHPSEVLYGPETEALFLPQFGCSQCTESSSTQRHAVDPVEQVSGAGLRAGL